MVRSVTKMCSRLYAWLSLCSLSVLPGPSESLCPHTENQASSICFRSSREIKWKPLLIQRAQHLNQIAVLGYISSLLCPACAKKLDESTQTYDFHSFLSFTPSLLCQWVCVHSNHQPSLHLTEYITFRKAGSWDPSQSAENQLLPPLTKVGHRAQEERSCPLLLAPDTVCIQE